jgi:DNA-binding NarL/FixJ family response regulator
MNPRAVIADDEPLMREQLRARLREAWPELEIVGEARNGIEAVEKTATLLPDLVFLDIRMPGNDRHRGGARNRPRSSRPMVRVRRDRVRDRV